MVFMAQIEKVLSDSEASSSFADEKISEVIGLGYTLMFLTHIDEVLEIEKFKRSRENKIEFAYDYGNLNASYVNEKINFEDDYFQKIINPDFEKINSPFQQTSLESSKKVCSESKNQSENDCLVIEKERDKEENPKVIASGIFKLNVSQCVSPILMSKSSCDSNNVEIKLKRKRHLDTFSSVRRPRHRDVIWNKKGSSNTSNVGLSDVIVSNLNKNVKRYSRKDLLAYTLSSLRRRKPSGVMWMRKGSSNTVKADLPSVNHSNLNKNVNRYSRKNLMACNNSDTCSAFDSNNARNALCNAIMNASVDVNDLFVFDD
nr:hypothetical protein [Tanacetum cinerariifolium]